MARSGRRFAVGANAYRDDMGTVFVYDLASGDGSKAEHWRRRQLTGHGTVSREKKRAGELRVARKGSGFGFSCAFDDSGQRLFVGSPGHDMHKGAVYRYDYNARRRKWIAGEALLVEGARNGDSFGWGVASSSDGCTVVAAAKGRRGNNGALYVMTCDADAASGYSVSARLEAPHTTDEVGPGGVRIRNNFGSAVAISADGSVIAAGAPGYRSEQGAVYVFERAGTSNGSTEWKLRDSLGHPARSAYSFFGFKLAMDSSGNTLAVGADGEADYTGAVYVFGRVAQKAGVCAIRSVVGPVRREVCIARPPAFALEADLSRGLALQPEDNFGGSVAIDAHGSTVLVGSPGARAMHGGSAASRDDERWDRDHGALHVFQRGKTEHYEGSARCWHRVTSTTVEGDHAQKGAFYAWAVATSADGRRFVATAPQAYSGVGVATVSALAGAALNQSTSGGRCSSTGLRTGRSN